MIAICVMLAVVCLAVALVFRQLRDTQNVDQPQWEKRNIQRQLDEERHSRQLAAIERFKQLSAEVRLFYQHPALPVDRVVLAALFDFEEPLKECIASPGEVSLRSQLLKATALECLSRISCLRYQFGEAERLLRSSLKLYLQSSKDNFNSDRESASVNAGIVQSRLGWVLSALGRPEEAARLWRESVETLSRHTAKVDSRVEMELAIATRNLGFVELAQSRPGDEYFQKSLRLSRELSSRLRDTAQVNAQSVYDVTNFALAAEFHIDTCQMLHARLWETGHRELSEAVAEESLQVFQQLLSIVERTPSHCPWQRYRQAELAARANLLAMQTHHSQAASQGSVSIPEQWQWRPLHNIPGQTIYQEYLRRGKMHAEFEPHEALMVSWVDEGWSSPSVVEIVAAASPRLHVFVLVADDPHEESARDALLATGVALESVTFWRVDSGTLWLRDFGPCIIETAPGRFSCLDSFYRSGEQPQEDILPVTVASRLGMVDVPSGLRLSGGEFLTNGAGLCVASTSVLESSRKSGLKDADLTARLKQMIGVDQIVFLEPLVREPTHHVDWFATFTSPDTVVIGDYRDFDQENAAVLNRNAELLSQVRTADGPLNVVRIPMPPPSGPDEQWFGGTYTNVVFANGVLLVPTWSSAPEALEHEAMRIYQDLLPGWDIVGINSDSLGRRNGGLHCATINLFRTKNRPAELPHSWQTPAHDLEPAGAR